MAWNGPLSASVLAALPFVAMPGCGWLLGDTFELTMAPGSDSVDAQVASSRQAGEGSGVASPADASPSFGSDASRGSTDGNGLGADGEGFDSSSGGRRGCDAAQPAAGGNGTAGGSGAESRDGALGQGGAAGQGGASGQGGAFAQGGASSQGGAFAQGGASSQGGAFAQGGASSQGGAFAQGGASSQGGGTGRGGGSSQGGGTGRGGGSSQGGSLERGGTTGQGGALGQGGTSSPEGGVGRGGSSSQGGGVGRGGANSPEDGGDGGATTGNLITNGDFSDGATNWHVLDYSTQTETTDYSVVTGALCMTPVVRDLYIVGWPPTGVRGTALDGGASYTFRYDAWASARLSSDSTGYAIHAKVGDAADYSSITEADDVPGTASQTFRHTFTAPTGSAAANVGVAFQFATTTASTVVCFDNITITRTP